MPFPIFLGHDDPSDPPGQPKDAEINFWFFLFFYYGFYNAAALFLITKIFNLYHLNWWPSWLGGKSAYAFFWILSEGFGICIYYFTGLEKYNLTWVGLTFITMAMPLLVAFLVIRSDNRNVYRHSLTEMQKTFLERQLGLRIPSSYFRFLWFCAALSIALFSLVLGESYATVYLENRPHSGLDGLVYVYSWVATIWILDTLTTSILDWKVKSYSLSFVLKLYYFLVYFIFYRNLFARLRSYNQFVLIQAASSIWVCVFYPVLMTKLVHRIIAFTTGSVQTLDDYRTSVGRSFYLRNLAENITMISFLGWTTILHFGPNSRVYPYFQFNEANNEYDYSLTFKASLGIWGSELVSSWITRRLFKWVYKKNITKDALEDFIKYPDILPTVIWMAIHVLQDMLLATLKLNFH